MEPTLTTLHATQALGLDPRIVEQVDANTIRLTFTHDQLDRLAHAEILTFDHDDCYSDDDVIEARAQGRRSVLAELKKLTGLTVAQLADQADLTAGDAQFWVSLAAIAGETHPPSEVTRRLVTAHLRDCHLNHPSNPQTATR